MVDIQMLPGFVPPGAIRQRIGTVDGPTHPVRRDLEAARKPSRMARLKAFLKLHFRAQANAA
jgi:hypothetical protein